MKYYLKDINFFGNDLNAGPKARNDINSILKNNNFVELCYECYRFKSTMKENKISNLISILKSNNINLKSILNKISILNNDDILFLQFPLLGIIPQFSKKIFNYLTSRNIKFVILIHDLDYLRHKSLIDKVIGTKKYFYGLKLANKVICHNLCMKQVLLENKVKESKILCLEMFDYLCDDSLFSSYQKDTIVVAGNLDRLKSGYIYKIPKNLNINLYGNNWSGETNGNCHYIGAFNPNILPGKLLGSYGLVWDGDDVTTCSGEFGNYLKYNNPHKASLYLAAGLPLIVWDNSALCSFVREKNVGITIDSLINLSEKLKNISHDEYEKMTENAKRESVKLKSGWYTEKVLKKCGLV